MWIDFSIKIPIGSISWSGRKTIVILAKLMIMMKAYTFRRRSRRRPRRMCGAYSFYALIDIYILKKIYCMRINQIPLINGMPMEFPAIHLWKFVRVCVRSNCFRWVCGRALLLQRRHFQLNWLACMRAVPIWKIIGNFIGFFQSISCTKLHEISSMLKMFSVHC